MEQTKRIMLTVAYEGTAYSGFALQKVSPKPTIEGCLNQAIYALTGKTTEVIGASRTDAGVHAYGNVVVFDTGSPIPADRFGQALNPLLPEDIRIIDAKPVADTFHPRHVKSRKTYEYRILLSPVPIPTLTRYTWRIPGDLDVNLMQEAADTLVGTHDFTSFCNVQTQSPDRIRNIEKILTKKEILADIPCRGEKAALVKIRVTGNGFLYHMVRIIAGTLVKVGSGKIPVEEMHRILEAKDRRAAGITAPPQGLFLLRYDFDGKYISSCDWFRDNV